MPHSETHTIILPHVLVYNAPNIPKVMERLAKVLPRSGGNAIEGLNVLLRKIGVSRALKDYGLKEEDIDRAVSIAISNPYWNPRAVERKPLRELLRRAWAGEDERADFEG